MDRKTIIRLFKKNSLSFISNQPSLADYTSALLNSESEFTASVEILKLVLDLNFGRIH